MAKTQGRELKHHQSKPNIQTATFIVQIVSECVYEAAACRCCTETLRPLVCTVMCCCRLEAQLRLCSGMQTSSVVFQPLGASDYLEMARLFDTVFIRHVPMLTLTLKDQARRFTTLIDNFYDKKVRVVLLAEAPLDRLFVHTGGQDERDRQLLDDLGLSGDAAERLTLFTAEEEIFAFQRTVSRLMEMQTESYWMEGDRSHSKKHMST